MPLPVCSSHCKTALGIGLPRHHYKYPLKHALGFSIVLLVTSHKSQKWNYISKIGKFVRL